MPLAGWWRASPSASPPRPAPTLRSAWQDTGRPSQQTRWQRNVRSPARHGSLAGCLAFGVGGVLDLAWHLTFGIERSFQALISPTHLILMGSGALIVSGPLRAAWRRPELRAGWPAVISATLLLAMFTFFGQFDHPFTSQWAAAPQPATCRRN